MQTWIGIGANLQAPVAQIKEAVRRIALISETDVISTSSMYRTRPWGDLDQGDFINAVVLLNTRLKPLDLLHQLQTIETGMGRVRKDRRWGPRLIDIDILICDQIQLESAELTIPHPHMHERAFVLLPLLELDPLIEIPAKGKADVMVRGLDTGGIERLSEAFTD